MVEKEGEIMVMKEQFDEISMQNIYEVTVWFTERPHLNFAKKVRISQD